MFETSQKVVQYVSFVIFLVICSKMDPFRFSQEIDEVSSQILAAEEVLLEALCFDFVIDSPHADLVDLFDAHDVAYRLQDYAWSIAHDSLVLMPMPMSRLCSDRNTYDFQVPHSPLRPLPTENHRYYLLHSRPTDRRWPTFPILGCPRVAVGTIGFIAHPSNP